MPWSHLLFFSGELQFMMCDVMNDVANFIVNIIRRLVKFAPDCHERLRMQNSFELYENSDWEMMKLVLKHFL
jgi:hypothetical protein